MFQNWKEVNSLTNVRSRIAKASLFFLVNASLRPAQVFCGRQLHKNMNTQARLFTDYSF